MSGSDSIVLCSRAAHLLRSCSKFPAIKNHTNWIPLPLAGFAEPPAPTLSRSSQLPVRSDEPTCAPRRPTFVGAGVFSSGGDATFQHQASEGTSVGGEAAADQIRIN